MFPASCCVQASGASGGAGSNAAVTEAENIQINSAALLVYKVLQAFFCKLVLEKCSITRDDKGTVATEPTQSFALSNVCDEHVAKAVKADVFVRQNLKAFNLTISTRRS